jgi:hypothetical protein
MFTKKIPLPKELLIDFPHVHEENPASEGIAHRLSPVFRDKIPLPKELLIDYPQYSEIKSRFRRNCS